MNIYFLLYILPFLLMQTFLAIDSSKIHLYLHTQITIRFYGTAVMLSSMLRIPSNASTATKVSKLASDSA